MEKPGQAGGFRPKPGQQITTGASKPAGENLLEDKTASQESYRAVGAKSLYILSVKERISMGSEDVTLSDVMFKTEETAVGTGLRKVYFCFVDPRRCCGWWSRT